LISPAISGSPCSSVWGDRMVGSVTGDAEKGRGQFLNRKNRRLSLLEPKKTARRRCGDPDKGAPGEIRTPDPLIRSQML
jgi:hypothetical protein